LGGEVMKSIKMCALILVMAMYFVVSTNNKGFAVEMKVYCFGDKKDISAPFPIEPTHLNGKYKETYMAQDANDKNNYQFYYDSYKYNSKGVNKDYLTTLANARAKALDAKIYSSKYTELPNGAQLVYGYRYKQQGVDVHSRSISVINNDEYFAWSVQSYPGFSTYDSAEIFSNYRKYVGKNTGYCK
jgi:hypothetical protein